ncbi:MAG: recombinase family protein [Eubacterium sp.]|nr:recombinase family protein [Eubacterium sp.]
MTVALYLRISREDKGAKESNSIGGQRSILSDYIKGQPELAHAKIVEFCDDGYSGRNFERPGVREMIEQAKKGAIQCIIVKDLSRFGRNYLEAGNYILRVFPFLGVRFIAVNDRFDSMRQMEADSLEVPFRTLLYDIYSRDLSHKVKSALYTKAQRGDYVSAFAPYGYKKDPADKHRIVPDEEAAAQVQRIFQMAADGKSTMQIARALNEGQVPTPLQYRRKNGSSHKGWDCIGAENFWTQQSVVKILRDERYTGKAVYGRRKRENAGDMRQVPVQKSGWITADNAYKGIVSKEEFRIVQKKLRIGRERGKNQKSGNPLLGKVRCAVCGRAMIRAGKKQAYFTCHTPRMAPAYDCPVLRVPQDCLLHIVQDGIRLQVLCTVDWQRIREELHRLAQQEQEEAEKKLLKLQEACSRLEAKRKEIYEQYVFGGLGRQEYLAAKEKSTKAYEKLERQAAKLKEELAAHETKPVRQEPFGWHSQYAIASQFAADCMQEALQEVLVCPGNLLIIVWNFRDEFAP